MFPGIGHRPAGRHVSNLPKIKPAGTAAFGWRPFAGMPALGGKADFPVALPDFWFTPKLT
jgi:hypothetical protein